MNTIPFRLNTSFVLIVLGSIFAIISTTAYSGEATPTLANGNRLIKTIGPIMLYEHEQGRGVTAIQFQLNGLITSAKVVEEVMILVFSGDIEIAGNGRGPFSPIRDLRSDKWTVEDLPIRVNSWSTGSIPWACRVLSFDETLSEAQRYVNDKLACRIALRDLSMSFTDEGSILFLCAKEVVIKDPADLH